MSIKVCARFRPESAGEEGCADFSETQVTLPPAGGAGSASGGGEPHDFSFDAVFSPDAEQADVYAAVGAPLVPEVLAGYNCTVFAYGQTGAGKTHTMFGDGTDGVIPRLVTDLFEAMAGTPEHMEYTVRVSFVEIYMERLTDLLDRTAPSPRLREQPGRGVFLDGATATYCGSAPDVMALLERGLQGRAVGATDCNAQSSRSHCVLIIALTVRDAEQHTEHVSHLYLVDLAGSEKVERTNVTGLSLKEAQAINKSLSALGNVINALTSNQAHVPYRDSKLTRLLQESIGGNAKTVLLTCASGERSSLNETLSTMRFGARAKRIRNHAKVNTQLTLKDAKLRIRELEAALATASSQAGEASGETAQLIEELNAEASAAALQNEELSDSNVELTRTITRIEQEQEMLRAEVAELRLYREGAELEKQHLQLTAERLQGMLASVLSFSDDEDDGEPATGPAPSPSSASSPSRSRSRSRSSSSSSASGTPVPPPPPPAEGSTPRQLLDSFARRASEVLFGSGNTQVSQEHLLERRRLEEMLANRTETIRVLEKALREAQEETRTRIQAHHLRVMELSARRAIAEEPVVIRGGARDDSSVLMPAEAPSNRRRFSRFASMPASQMQQFLREGSGELD